MRKRPLWSHVHTRVGTPHKFQTLAVCRVCWVGGRDLLRIMPLRGSIFQDRTCKILSKTENLWIMSYLDTNITLKLNRLGWQVWWKWRKSSKLIYESCIQLDIYYSILLLSSALTWVPCHYTIYTWCIWHNKSQSIMSEWCWLIGTNIHTYYRVQEGDFLPTVKYYQYERVYLVIREKQS